MMKPEAGEFDLDLMPDLPALFQPGDLAVGDLPLLQPLGCGIQQRLGSVRSGSRQELLCHHVVLLGCYQLRAIDGQERLALPHLFVCCVGIYFLHPAGEANLHVGKPRFIRLDIADGADLVADRSKLDDTGLHPDALHPLGCQRDRRQVWFGSRCCLRHSFREPKGGTMPRLSAGTEANGRRGGEDDRRAACPRAAHSSPPIKRSIEASIVCSSNSSWSSLSSRSWTWCCASSVAARSPRPWA